MSPTSRLVLETVGLVLGFAAVGVIMSHEAVRPRTAMGAGVSFPEPVEVRA